MMYKVRNKSALRDAYEMLHILENGFRRGEFVDEYRVFKEIHRIKREIRSYQKQPSDPERCIYAADTADYFVTLQPLPPCISSLEQADAYVEMNIVIPRPCFVYDCTGLRFTSWYRCFERRGEFWCYHGIGVDV